MKFHVEGPFELPRANGLIDSSCAAKRKYWDNIEADSPGLPDACGCYVFTVIASRGSLPWYVGKVEKRTFREESLAHHKLTHFNTVISDRSKGKPVLFFLPQVTATTGKYSKSKSSKSPAIRELESWLIGMALNRNEKLRNVAGTKWPGQLKVTGFLNNRKSKGGPAKKLRDLFNT